MPSAAASARIVEIDAELAAIRAARLKVVTGGQAYQADGRQMTRADLRGLRELEKDLQQEQARLRRGGRIPTFGVVVR